MEFLKVLRVIGNTSRRLGNDLLDVIAPPTCEVCGEALVEGEQHICLQCFFNLPRCKVHGNEFNTIHQRMMRRVPIERAAAYFYYVRQSPYTALIHSAKYRGRPNIIRYLAAEFAKELLPDGFFDTINGIIPVAMHPLKQLRRGYNQTTHLARGLSDIVALPIYKNLHLTHSHSTQTRKSAIERWLNATPSYRVSNPRQLAGKHILVVDDVITTGATITACCEAIHAASPSTKISVLSLGLTDLT